MSKYTLPPSRGMSIETWGYRNVVVLNTDGDVLSRHKTLDEAEEAKARYARAERDAEDLEDFNYVGSRHHY